MLQLCAVFIMNPDKRKNNKGAFGRHWKLSKRTKKRQCIAAQKRGNSGNGFKKGHIDFVSLKSRKQAGKKISKVRMGHSTSEKMKEILRNLKKGTKLSEESKRKISEANSGKNHWNWQDGKSFEPYTTDWTQTLKRSIRERDHYICQLCGKPQEDRALSVHHIDYDKENCNPNNLISLCRSCHMKIHNGTEKLII